MGRDSSRRETDYMTSALEVYSMVQGMTHDDERALREAIEGAVSVAGRDCLTQIRNDLLILAEGLDADEDNDLNEDGVAALISYAISLDEQLPPEYRMENTLK